MEIKKQPAEQDYLAVDRINRPVKLGIGQRIGRNLMHLVGVTPKSPYMENASWNINSNRSTTAT